MIFYFLRNRNTFLIVPVFIFFSCTACSPYASTDLVGEWQAVELSEEGDSLKVDTKDVRFQFFESGRYQYHSTLNYSESGQYKLDGKYLLSTDTTRNDQAEKAVEIIKLVNDSLVIKMKEKGKERIAVFLRE